MSRFRKKPVVVDAVQYVGPREIGRDDAPPRGPLGVFWVRVGSDMCQFPCVTTIHGQETFVAPGDWIITESDGVHHYPCKPDIFAATYDPVESE